MLAGPCVQVLAVGISSEWCCLFVVVNNPFPISGQFHSDLITFQRDYFERMNRRPLQRSRMPV